MAHQPAHWLHDPEDDPPVGVSIRAIQQVPEPALPPLGTGAGE